jgi:hypothetical protein
MSGTDYTLTPNLGLFKPIYDADIEMWGGHINANADVLDQAVLVAGLNAAIEAYFAALPTTAPPDGSGKLFWNGGVLCRA